MALTHHHTSQDNQCRRTETELFGSQQCHADNIPSGLQLSVGLQAYLSAQAVQHQCLLSLAQPYFGRDARIAH